MIKATGKEWRYAYDAYDRLLSAGLFPSAASSSPEQNVVYTLDALNRRVQRQEQRPQGNFARENYYHDGWDIDSVDERFNQTLTRRAWFSMVGVDNPYAMTVWNGTSGPSTTSYYYSSDVLGSTRALHADNGTIVAQYDYDTYGMPEVLVESVPQPFLYTGREYDRVTGLYHYRAREYDPNTGRFLQEDPIWFNAGDHNVYRYVGSRPTRFTDPSGLDAKEKAALAGLALGSAVAMMATAERINCNLGIIASALHFARENAFIDDGSAAIIGAIDDVACVVVGSRKPPRATPTPGITPGKPGKGGGGPGKGGGSNNAGGGGGSGGGAGGGGGSGGPSPPPWKPDKNGEPTLKPQKQDQHTSGSPNERGKTFRSREEADAYSRDTRLTGDYKGERPGGHVWEKDYGQPIGTKGETCCRYIQDGSGRGHGFPIKSLSK